MRLAEGPSNPTGIVDLIIFNRACQMATDNKINLEALGRLQMSQEDIQKAIITEIAKIKGIEVDEAETFLVNRLKRIKDNRI